MTFNIKSYIAKHNLMHLPDSELLEKIEQYCNRQMYKRKPNEGGDFYQYQMDANKIIAINYMNDLRGTPHSTTTEKVKGLNYFKMIDSLYDFPIELKKSHIRNMMNADEFERLGAFLGW